MSRKRRSIDYYRNVSTPKPVEAKATTVEEWWNLAGVIYQFGKLAVGLIVFCAVLYVVGAAIFGGSTAKKGTVTQSLGSREVDALTLCQAAIKREAKDPETAVVPYVSNTGNTLAFEFAWAPSTSLIRMRNGLGLEVTATGVCRVDTTSGKITSLTVQQR